MHAQPGALAAQMFTLGRTDEGSSRFPARITRNCGRADEKANRCVPQLGQNCRVTRLPLSALFVCAASGPETASASAGTRTLTVPFAARCWQSRHQHTRVASGSAARVKLTAPHRQRPDRSVIGWFLGLNDIHLGLPCFDKSPRSGSTCGHASSSSARSASILPW